MTRAALLAIACTACAHSATPAAAALPIADARARIAHLALCTTTEAEVRGWFGEPVRDGRQGRLRIEDWLIAEHPERVLAIVIDERGIVVDLIWDTPGGASWLPADLCAPAAAAP